MRTFFLSLMSVIFLFGAETVTDNATSLMWQDNSEVKTIRQDAKGAKAYCDALALEGFDDWRLPTVKELQSILDIGREEPMIKKSFTHVDTIGFYWSSSLYASDKAYGWMIYFYNGNTEKAEKSEKGFIRCVRNP